MSQPCFGLAGIMLKIPARILEDYSSILDTSIELKFSIFVNFHSPNKPSNLKTLSLYEIHKLVRTTVSWPSGQCNGLLNHCLSFTFIIQHSD